MIQIFGLKQIKMSRHHLHVQKGEKRTNVDTVLDN